MEQQSNYGVPTKIMKMNLWSVYRFICRKTHIFVLELLMQWCFSKRLMYNLVSQNWTALSNFSELTINVVRFLKSQKPNLSIFEIYLVNAESATMRRILQKSKFLKKEFYRQFFVYWDICWNGYHRPKMQITNISSID